MFSVERGLVSPVELLSRIEDYEVIKNSSITTSLPRSTLRFLLLESMKKKEHVCISGCLE